MVGGIAAAATIVALTLAAACPALDGEITSEGPLTRIIVTADLNCQVAHRADASLEFFGADVGACGTFLAVSGSLYGPTSVPSGDIGGRLPWTAVSQAPVTGSGSGGDPFRLVTTVDAGSLPLRIEQTDSYQVGKESYRTDIRISNSGDTQLRGILYRAGDCFLQDSDTGFGRVDRGAPACVISQASDARIEQWVPITSGSHYFEGVFSEVWQRIASQQPFPDECLCEQAVDNGGGLSWEVVIPAGGRVEVAHETFFSPEGRNPSQAFAESIPGPADISLDPVVIASSAAIAAGVVVFMPFPAALFNSTLQENYVEVMAAVARFRGWLAHLFALGFARLRRAWGSLPSRRQAGTADPPGEANLAAESAPAARRVKLDAAFWRSPVGILSFVLVSALLNGLLDPTFGFAVESVATFLGLALGLGVMLLAFAVPLFIGSRGLKVGMHARALPGTLLIAVVCVLISRIANFQPGYLYGLIIGFTFSRELSKAESGKLDAVAAACALGLAVVAWLLLPMVRGDAGGSAAFGAILLQTAYASVVTAGLEAAAISMMPLRFLPGEKVRAWNRRVWIALLGIATFGFCHILLNPSSGYLADTTRTSLFTVIWLMAAFGGGSVLFWAYFRFRAQPGAAGSPPSTAGEPPATA